MYAEKKGNHLLCFSHLRRISGRFGKMEDTR